MKNKLFLMITISAFGIFFAGCSASFSTGSNTAAVKPANTSASPAAKIDSNSASTAKNDEPKTVVKDEKKPEGTAKTAKKDVPVPADWVYFYDNKKGYGFSIPEGTTSETDDSNGVDFTALPRHPALIFSRWHTKTKL